MWTVLKQSRAQVSPVSRAVGAAAALLCWLLLALPEQASAAPSAPSTGAGNAAAWAQQQICEGKPADFNQRLQTVADPRQSQGWDHQRLLDRDFLIAMISGGPCPLPPYGIDIAGAWFKEPIDLQGSNIPMQLQIRNSRFEAELRLDRVSAGKLLSFAGSRFGGPLLMTELAVRGSLLLGDGASFEDKVVLGGASVDGQANFSSKEKCAVGQGTVGQTAVETAVETADEAVDGREGCDDTAAPTHFAGDLDLSGSRVSRILDFRNVVADANVTFDRGRIDGELRLSGSRFGKDLSMDALRVGESVEAWNVIWGRVVDGRCAASEGGQPGQAQGKENRERQWKFYNASIGSSLYLTGACLPDLTTLNLAGTRIGGQLFLGSIDHYPPNIWGPNSTLILRNAAVDKIQDVPAIRVSDGPNRRDGAQQPSHLPGMLTPESWPLKLELDGFSYTSWDGLGRQERLLADGGRRVVPRRDEDWLIRWLARDPSYSRQRYEQLARVMASQGRQDVGNDVLFTSREIERCIAIHGVTSKGIEGCILRTSGITPSPAEAAAAVPSHPGSDQAAIAQAATGVADSDAGADERLLDYGVRTTIFVLNGYGYRPIWALGWFFVLILIGTLLFRYRTKEGRTRSVWFATEYTFDTLLPAVNLCKDFNDINIENGVRYYFIALKVLGYVFVATLLQFFYQIAGRSLT